MLKKKYKYDTNVYFNFYIISKQCSCLKLEGKSHEPNTYGMYNM